MVGDLSSPADDKTFETANTYTLRVGCGWWESLTKDNSYVDYKTVIA